MSDEALLPRAEAPSMARAALCLSTAIVCEVGGTLCMRMVTQQRIWTLPAYVAYAVSFGMFPQVMESIPLHMAYITWSAVGSVLVTLASVLLFGDPLSARQGAALVVIVSGVVALYV